jgi:hypothetical protein
MPGRHKKCTQNFDHKASKEGPLGRLRQRWQDNIKVNFKEMGCKGMGWACSASLDAGSCKQKDKQLWSIKGGKLLDILSSYWCFYQDSTRVSYCCSET